MGRVDPASINDIKPAAIPLTFSHDPVAGGTWCVIDDRQPFTCQAIE
jgi:hypothetical protein